MLKNKKTPVVLLIGIFVLAFFLRTLSLTKTPSGFHADEASFYVNALALAQTGADEDGIRLPLSLSSIIDPKPAFYSYLQIPFTTLFENHILASRLPAVLLSLISLFVLYLTLARIATTKIALLTTFVLAVSPWHIIVSRGTQEVIASFLFLVLSLYLVILYLQKVRCNKMLLLGSFSVAAFLSMYLYHSAKVLLPLLVFGLLVYFYKKSNHFIKTSVLILGLSVGALLASFIVQESSSRVAAVSIFSDSGPEKNVTKQIYSLHEALPISLTRIFYNKGQTYFIVLAEHYMEYFSPTFLFLEGAKPTRYVVPEHGLLYLLEVPILLLGLYVAVRTKKKENILFLGLLLLSPIPAAVTTQETPSMIRAFPMVISFAYFIAVGLDSLLQVRGRSAKYLLLTVLAGSYTWFIGYFSIQYHIQAYYDMPFFRNSPYSAIAREVSIRDDSYDHVYTTNDLRPLYLYFVIENLISIEELQSNPYARDKDTYTLGTFTFNRDVCEFPELRPGSLYIAEKECRENKAELKDLELVKSITYQDGTPVYELLQVAQ